jgi:chromosome segregation ATPase
MDLNELELSVGDVRLRGVVIAVVLGFASTIATFIYQASTFMSDLDAQTEAVAVTQADAISLAQRFNDLRESNAMRLQEMDKKLATMEQSMSAADVVNLQGKLATLGGTLTQIMDKQSQLNELMNRQAETEKLASETQLRVEGKLKELQAIEAELSKYQREVEDIWRAVDSLNPLGGE